MESGLHKIHERRFACVTPSAVRIRISSSNDIHIHHIINLSFRLHSQPLHLRFNLPMQLLQRLHIRLTRRPPDAQPFFLTRLRNHVEMHMVDDLVCPPPIVLKDVVLLRAGRLDELLHYRLFAPKTIMSSALSSVSKSRREDSRIRGWG